MTRYLSVVQRAVDTLESKTAEARAALYEQARDMLRTRLPQSKLSAELSSLDEAIELVEAEAVRRDAGARPLRRPRPVRPLPEVVPGPPGERAAAAAVAAAAASAAAGETETEPTALRVPLADSRRRWRTAAGLGAVLVVAAIGATAYWLWPKRAQQQTASVVERRAAAINYVYLRQPVYYRTTHPVGTIVVDKAQSFLYVVRPNVVAIRYGIGRGRDCNDARGLYRVTRKEEWPEFHGKPEDRLKNRFGARAIYFNEKYRIHGTNTPIEVIGADVKVGCLYLSNEDVIELSDKTPVEARVVVTE